MCAFMPRIATPTTVIMQPTTFCNLDCRYCYLPMRRNTQLMSLAVAHAVARSVVGWAARGTVEIVWHGGEPLAAGTAHLDRLMGCFDGLTVKHQVQTNATLITDAWCDLFTRRDVHIGVSIDGPPATNHNRVNLAGRPMFDRILRGIDLLHHHQIPYSMIAVVSDPTPTRAADLYDFAVDIGATSLGVNLEEQEGVNLRDTRRDAHDVIGFWHQLTRSWQHNPVLAVRDIDRVRALIDATLTTSESVAAPPVDPLPTVAYDGTVTLISPELAGFTSPAHGSFACGTVLTTALDDLIATGLRAPWVRQHLTGIAACAQTCPYFTFCGGGHPANKYFELGRLDATRTTYCTNSKIRLMEGVLHAPNDR